MYSQKEILEAQLRECYGRIIYTHKTHEKQADIIIKSDNCIQWCKVIISAIISVGLLNSIFDIKYLVGYKEIGLIISTILSTILLILNTYTKSNNLGELAQKHRQAGADLWLIREKYLSLLTDLNINNVSLDEIIKRRDELLQEQYLLYKAIPSTNSKAYTKAQKALKELEDMTFTDEEIDKFLPTRLKKTRDSYSASYLEKNK